MDIESSGLWIVIVGFIVAFVLAFGLGANDVANSFGTSVGAKVLTIRQACILGTIFEILGAVLVGAKVSNTIRKGIVSPDIFTNGTEEMFLAGNAAALTGSCIWLLAATFFSLPVSGTHSIVGATLGFSLVINGTKGISWMKLGMIVGSWFISPLISGIVSCLMFKSIDMLVLKKTDPLKYGLRLLPVFYGLTLAVNLFSVFYEGSQLLHFDKIPLYGVFILTFGGALLAAIFVRIVVVPRQRKKITKDTKDTSDEEALTEWHKPPPKTIGEAFDQSLTVQHGNILPSPSNKQLSTLTEQSSKLEDSLARTSNKEHDNRDEVDDDSSKLLTADTKYETKDVEKAVKEDGGKFKVDAKSVKLGEITDEEASLENGTGNAEEARQLVVKASNAKISKKAISDTSKTESKEATSLSDARDKVQDHPEAAQLFTFLQVLTAVFGSFAHGGNDVSNAIGPLVAIWVTFSSGSTAQTVPVPIWVLIYGGAGISVGLWVWGRRVMKTMGEDLTKITPSSGFCIEVGSALTVIAASNIGIPISTTHCKVGSVVCVGRVRSRGSVNWNLFRNIIFAWCVTLPVSGGLSALAMLGFRAILNAL